MLIKTSHNGDIIENQSIINRNTYRMDDSFKVFQITNPQVEEFVNGSIIFDQPYICIEDDKLKFIALPANYSDDIYYTKVKEGYIITDDFFKIANKLGVGTFDIELKEIFTTKSYLPLGETWIKEIKRFSPHNVYLFRVGSFHRKSIKFLKRELNNDDIEAQYRTFKNSLNTVIDMYASTKKNAVLLSGGADSRLLAILLSERGHYVESYTGRQIPYSIANLEDVEIAINISDSLKIKHNILDVDFNDLSVQYLDEVIEKMPNAMHLSALFYDLSEKISSLDAENIWCGQNADNLYNLGPTGKFNLSFSGWMNLFKRFCITEHFFKTYNSVEGHNSVIKITNNLIGLAGAKTYSKMKKIPNVRLPKTPEELIRNFLASYDDTIFSLDDTSEYDSYFGQYKPKDIKDIIFNNKVENYMRGGASSIVNTTASIFGLNSIMPFSNEIMLPVFNDLSLNLKDLFKPKEFIYRYIKEFESKYGVEINRYNGIEKRKILDKYPKALGVHDSAMQIINNTNFGNELLSCIDRKHIPSGTTGIQNLQIYISQYWIKRVKSYLIDKYEVDLL